jgi:hypothetical protein
MATRRTLAVKLGSRYASLENDRRPFLDRARQCAALTIPAILPDAGFSQSSQLPTPYQSLGARGARTLASKLLLSLYPAIPFFNYRIDDKVLEELGAARGEFEKALASRERAVATELEACVFRPAAFVSLMHLVVTGNSAIYIPPKQGDRARSYRLDQYVCRRDSAGNLLEVIIWEKLDFASVPEDIRKQIATLDAYKGLSPEQLQQADVNIYTVCFRDSETGKWVCYQEAADIFIESSWGTYVDGEMPWLVLRFATQPGEHYGRSYVEEYLGDLDSLEALSETLVEGSAASARVVFMVNPAGVTSIQVVQKARNGATVPGNAADVTAMQVQKQQDLATAKATADEIANRLSYAFLLHSSIQRQGERVTAEEIRYMASELDDGLGGVYTLLAADFQMPSVRLFEKRMEKRLGQPKLPTDKVHPVLVSGLEAIGRGHDQRNLKAFIADFVSTLTPEYALRYINGGELASRSAAAYSVDPTGLIKTEEEVQQAEQQGMMQQMMQQLGPNAINQMGGLAGKAMDAQAEQQQPPAQGTE